ncbi:hypothetical protein Ae406Ps2_6462 [Pseudonocardia sp. Ae406_Ps2]|nr:hypothetical protein Ae406Ps2_6462 [Pseudonocardia sp. Ae406_Ps2]
MAHPGRLMRRLRKVSVAATGFNTRPGGPQPCDGRC